MEDQDLTIEDFLDVDFIMVRPRLVRKFGGDTNAVLMIARVQFRGQVMPIGVDGHRWWKATYQELADETGLSPKQARRVIDALVDRGFVLAKIDNDSTWDRTRSYRVQLSDLHMPSRANACDPQGECISPTGQIDVPVRADLLSTKEGFKELKPSPSPAYAVEAEFDRFWSVYPKKVNKIEARKKFEIALRKNKDLTPDTLVDAALAYAEYEKARGTERRFIKGPDVWLNKGCWLDELASERINGGGLVERNGVPMTRKNAEAYDLLQAMRANAPQQTAIDQGAHARELEGAPW